MTVTDEQVVALLPVLEEAARASQRTVERFVPPRTGIVEQVAAARHQFILGRRGVGKTTLLRRVEKQITDDAGAVAFIDLETLRGIPYPDVLLHLLIRLFDALDQQLLRAAEATRFFQRRRLRVASQKVARTRDGLKTLLNEPQLFERTVTATIGKAAELGASARLRAKIATEAVAGAGADINVGGSASASRTRIDEARATFTETKMDSLSASATELRNAVASAIESLGGNKSTIVLDDFYHVSGIDQPHVLGFLHQIVKNLDVWLKVGAVRHRLTSFIEGDPPVGLQIGDDASEVSLDVTLEHFPAAKTFLERVLESLLTPLDVRVEEILTDTARDRLVLASGGVARDYLNLAVQALRSANDRPGTANRPHNRITAEDVNEVSARLADQKQNDLALDAGPNADALRDRFSDLVSFCLDRNRKNVFLVEAIHLREQDWGKEIETLADLRFVHRISTLSVQDSDYRGRQFVAMTLDLSSYTTTRSERIEQVEFWKPGGAKQLRSRTLIYAPSDTGHWKRVPKGDRQQDPLPTFEQLEIESPPQDET